MAKWFERSEGRAEAGEWAVEVQKTSLPGEVERFWEEWVEKEEERRREREGVRGDCDGVGRKVEGWMREFGEGVEEGERDKVWEGLKALKAKMEDEEVDTQGLKEGMEELMEVRMEAFRDLWGVIWRGKWLTGCYRSQNRCGCWLRRLRNN